MDELNVIKLADGVEATFLDGHRATLTVKGSSCTCNRSSGVPCGHIRALIPAYNKRKWELAESMVRSWGPSFYKNIRIDPRIFFPPEIDWNQYPDEDMVYVRHVQSGYLFIFRDGAHLWVGKEHPEGRTKCSLCGTRDCRHYEEVVAELRVIAGDSQTVAA